MNEDHDRIQELLAGYVLLSLSGEDAVEADRLLSEHVPSCPLCRDQVAGFQAVAGDLALAVSPVQPPDLLLPRIRRGVDETPIRGRHRASLVAVAAGVAAGLVEVSGPGLQLMYVIGRDAPMPSSGRVYQLWLGANGTFVRVEDGWFVPEDGLVLLELAADTARYDEILITEERIGDAPASPSHVGHSWYASLEPPRAA